MQLKNKRVILAFIFIIFLIDSDLFPFQTCGILIMFKTIINVVGTVCWLHVIQYILFYSLIIINTHKNSFTRY